MERCSMSLSLGKCKYKWANTTDPTAQCQWKLTMPRTGTNVDDLELRHSWWQCKWHLHFGNVWQFHLNIQLSNKPLILLGLYPKEMQAHVHTEIVHKWSERLGWKTPNFKYPNVHENMRTVYVSHPYNAFCLSNKKKCITDLHNTDALQNNYTEWKKPAPPPIKVYSVRFHYIKF